MNPVPADPDGLHVRPLDTAGQAGLAALQTLSDAQGSGRPRLDLQSVLTDGARGQGRQVVVAWQNGQPVGCLGWVSLGLAEDGRLYGAPLIAQHEAAAEALLASLAHTGQALGASHLRVSSWSGEAAKRQALLQRGYQPLFEWVNFARPTHTPLPLGGQDVLRALTPVDWPAIDWPRAAQLSADCFRDVPNSPAVGPEVLAEDWAEADWDCSALLQDSQGRYAAYVIVSPEGAVDAVGVAPPWRGRGVADALYARACAALAAKGRGQATALVASSNTASMRLHQRLGFTEWQVRGTVWECALAAAA